MYVEVLPRAPTKGQPPCHYHLTNSGIGSPWRLYLYAGRSTVIAYFLGISTTVEYTLGPKWLSRVQRGLRDSGVSEGQGTDHRNRWRADCCRDRRAATNERHH